MKYYLITCLLVLHTALGWTQAAQQDMPMHDLRSSHLAASNLTTYEQQAQLALQDALDYITLVGQQEYDLIMRKTVLESVLSTFHSSASVPCDWILPASKSASSAMCPLGDVLSQLLTTPCADLQVEYTNIRMKTPLTQKDAALYLGQLIYEQTVWFKTTPNAVAKKIQQTIVLDVALSRTVKHFGIEQEKIWEIQFLGVTSPSE